ncbi:MAG TPA: isochorismatase family protein [Candidatus Limnocylindrales bacterium]
MRRYGSGVALLVVDMQNDFADPRGSLHVAGAEAIVPVINAQIALARQSRSMVIYTQDWHPTRTPHFAIDGGTWPVHCVARTWGAELHPTLDCAQGSPMILKGTNGEDGYSAFTMRDPATDATVPTPLEPLLIESGVSSVVVVGVATDYCVRATALDAMRLGFEATVLTDAVAAVDLRPGDGDRALAEIAAAGAIITSSQADSPAGSRAP